MLLRLLAALCLIPLTRAPAAEWALAQFPNSAPILTFESGTTAMPLISGLLFCGQSLLVPGCGDSTFSGEGHGSQLFGNLSTVNGYTPLSIVFTQPKQAVGAYLVNVEPVFQGTITITQTVYGQSNNVLASTSRSVRYFPEFVGLGFSETNIYRVEWTRGCCGFFGVDDVIYTPGASIQFTNLTSSPTNLTFGFRSVPGRTNMVETGTNLARAGWTVLSNFVGDGSLKRISIPKTNLAAAFFRVRSP
jgi:hypothetical protein